MRKKAKRKQRGPLYLILLRFLKKINRLVDSGDLTPLDADMLLSRVWKQEWGRLIHPS